MGAVRADGFHDLLTVYQTIGLHDLIRISVNRGRGIEIHCADSRVPGDESNTCWRIVEKVMRSLKARGRVVVEIEKRLPVQGGMGGASANAVSTMLALERALKKNLPAAERLKIAAEVGSDLPLFLMGGTVLGVGRGGAGLSAGGFPPDGLCGGDARSGSIHAKSVCRVGSKEPLFLIRIDGSTAASIE